MNLGIPFLSGPCRVTIGDHRNWVFPLHLLCQFIRSVKLAVHKTTTLSARLTRDETGVLWIARTRMPMFLTISTLHARHVHALFKLWTKSFLSWHPPPPLMSWSQRWQLGSSHFSTGASLQKQGGVLFWLSPQVNCLTLHLCSHAADSLPCF